MAASKILPSVIDTPADRMAMPGAAIPIYGRA